MVIKKNNKRRHISTKRKALKLVPSFKNLEEEAHFWDTHDTTEYALVDLDETIEAAGLLKASFEKRRAARLAVLEKVKDYLIDEVGNMVLPGTPILDKKAKAWKVPVLCRTEPGIFVVGEISLDQNLNFVMIPTKQQMLKVLKKTMRRVPVLVYADPSELRKKGVRHVTI
jgi:hypothetical protein